MKKLNLKSIKDGKWQKSSAQLSDSEMNNLKGGGSGCGTFVDGVLRPGSWMADCDYPSEFLYNA